jgi:aspartokinase
MVTVAHVVTRILEDMPFLEEALTRGIINYAYLAEMIRPRVEEEMRKKVKRAAIMMAIRRFRETLKNSAVDTSAIHLSVSDITLRSGIFEVTVPKTQSTIEAMQKIYSIVDFSKGDVLTITQGLYEITIISNSKYKDQITKLFGKDQIIKVNDGLSSLMVKISDEAAEAVGVLYLLVKALSWNNVNIVEVVSTYTEEIFIIREKDASIAFNALKALIKGNA